MGLLCPKKFNISEEAQNGFIFACLPAEWMQHTLYAADAAVAAIFHAITFLNSS